MSAYVRSGNPDAELPLQMVSRRGDSPIADDGVATGGMHLLKYDHQSTGVGGLDGRSQPGKSRTNDRDVALVVDRAVAIANEWLRAGGACLVHSTLSAYRW